MLPDSRNLQTFSSADDSQYTVFYYLMIEFHIPLWFVRTIQLQCNVALVIFSLGNNIACLRFNCDVPSAQFDAL